MRPPGRVSDGFGVAIGALLLVLCCAGPALVARGALATIGSILGDPAVIGVGAALLVGALAVTYERHTRGDRRLRAASRRGRSAGR